MSSDGHPLQVTGDALGVALDAVPDAIVLVAIEWNDAPIVYANAAARTLPAAMPGQSVRQLASAGFGAAPAQIAELEHALHQARAATLSWQGCRQGLLTLRLVPLPTPDQSPRMLLQWTVDAHQRAPAFSTLADHIPDPVFVLELDSTPPVRIAYVNRAATNCYGYRADEMIGQSILELLDSPCTAKHAPDRIARLRAGEIVTFEGLHRRKNGSLLPIEARSCLISWQGRPAILAIDRDITVYKRDQADLAAAADRLRMALAAGRTGMFDWDLESNRIVWSPFHYELFGYAATDTFAVEFHHFQDRIHVDDWAALAGAIATARAQKTEYHHIARVVRPDGSTRWFSGTGRFQYDDGGNATRMLGMVRDETDERQAEAQLREHEQFLTAVIEGSPIGIQIFTPSGTSLRTNEAMRQLIGLPNESSGLDKYCLLTDPEAQRVGVADIFRQCVAGRPARIERREVDFTSPSYAKWPGHHRRFWLESVFFPVLGPNHEVHAVVAFNWDVTDRVEAELTRQRLQEQLRQAQKLEAIGLLAGGVAHDFNNVLTAVMGFADILRSLVPANDPNLELVHQIRLAAARGTNLTRQLLSFSRKQILRPEVFELGAEIHSMVPMLRRLLATNMQFDVQTATVGGVLVDRGQFQQVLLNLVVNARDAMPNGGCLTIRTAAGQMDPGTPAVRLTVTDTGTGMTDEVKAHLFEPFFTTKEHGRGTGLGLATVYGIVSQSGGRIELESSPGNGSVFHILWPRCEHANAAPTNQIAITAAPRTETLLVVEDDPANRDLAARILTHEGYTIITAASGEDALAVAESIPHIDLLLTDVVMPGIGGRILAERLVKARPGLRVVFMSGCTTDDVLRHGVSENTVAFLQKPYSADQLARIVQHTLDA